MRIMVFDVPAESGGALTILKEYYDKATLDIENEWVFVLSRPTLKSRNNIKVLNYPWIKKSWLHRLYFDFVVAPKLPRIHDIDEILSLQNVIIPKVDIKQTLYLHQSLPFTEIKYKPTENLKFWVYQNIISKLIYKSIKKADGVIVQTRWMIKAAVDKTGVSKEKFILQSPNINSDKLIKYSAINSSFPTFFYPAGSMDYKNHKIIIEACKNLKRNNLNNYKVVITLEGNENKKIRYLYETVIKLNLPIEFVGNLGHKEVFRYYSKSILLFPSYIETFGLPLLEAREHNTPILASNCTFSHEILDDYDKVLFFDPFDDRELTEYMKKIILKQF